MIALSRGETGNGIVLSLVICSKGKTGQEREGRWSERGNERLFSFTLTFIYYLVTFSYSSLHAIAFSLYELFVWTHTHLSFFHFTSHQSSSILANESFPFPFLFSTC